MIRSGLLRWSWRYKMPGRYLVAGLLASSREPRVVKVDGRPFLASDRPVQTGAGTVELFSRKLVASSLHPGSTFVDVGACNGLYSLAMARLIGRAGHVFAYEPDPANQATLLLNRAWSGLDNITVFPHCVTDRNGPVQMARCLHPGWTKVCEGRPLEPFRVSGVTLDRHLEGLRFDALKIDVEGHEVAVLEGARRLLSENPRAGILVECTPSTWPGVREILSSLGRTGAHVNDYTETLHPEPGNKSSWNVWSPGAP